MSRRGQNREWDSWRCEERKDAQGEEREDIMLENHIG